MTLLPDAVGGASAQDVDQMPGPEGLAPLTLQPDDRGQQLLSGHESVPRVRRLEARVAVAAGPGCLAEVVEQVLAPACDRLAQRQHGVEVLAEPQPIRAVARALID